MKIEMDEHVATGLTLTALIIAAALTIMFVVHEVYSVDRDAIKAGLHQDIGKGSVRPVWTKPNTNGVVE